MLLVLWLIAAWMAGTIAILGSLMTIASLLLWVIPSQKIAPFKQTPEAPTVRQFWKGRLRVFLFSLMLTLAGLSSLVFISFPSL